MGEPACHITRSAERSAVGFAKTLIAVAVFACSMGCTKVNSLYCEAQSDCAPGWVCNTTGQECFFDGRDAGYDGPGCAASSSCPESEPICSPDNACVSCSAGAAGAQECADRDPLRPLCQPDGRCAECLGNDDCTDITAAFCDGITGACRGCVAHDECSAEVCNRDIGTCADAAGILYVDNDGGVDSVECGSQAQPCATIGGTNGALVKVAPTLRTIRVRAGVQAYPEALVLDGISVVIVGADATVRPVVANTAALVVRNGANVTIDGLSISGATGDANADGVRCSGAGSIVRLIAVTVSDNANMGIEIESPCDLRVARSMVRNNTAGGIRVRSDDFAIVNNFIVDNGSGGAPVGGVRLEQAGAAGARNFAFNTIAGNRTGGAAVGVFCQTSLDITATLVWANTGGAPLSANCSASYSDIEGGAAGDGNIDADPSFADVMDYHLGENSACIDAAAPNGAPVMDIDGDPRPSGAGPDIGADERTEASL